MCLFATKKKNNSHIKTLKKDRIVYKVFKLFSNNQLISPFRSKRYDIGKTYLIKDSTINKYWKYCKCGGNDWEYGRNVIIENGIHSFSNFEDAKKLCDTSSNLVIYKCIIPKESKYVLGTDMTKTRKEIVSSKIKIIKKCVY